MNAPRHPPAAAVCTTLDPAQANVLVEAIPSPAMVVNVHDNGMSVLAIDPLLRRFVAAHHPAGPRPDERLAIDALGVLADVVRAAIDAPAARHVTELPIGDEPLWFEVTVTPITGDGAVRQIILVATDRTADHDLEHRQRRAARRFEAMVQHAPGLILLVDSAGRILRASPGIEQSIGLAARELVGRAIFEILHPDTLARAASIFNQILGLPAETVAIDDFRVAHADGGFMWCEAHATNLLHDDDVAAIVINAHDVTDRKLAEERLELQASCDALTALPNRRQLAADIELAFEEAARRASSVGLLLIDLDEFKLVNDALGHDIGDAVIRVVASRLTRLAGNDAEVARIGGDEFAVLLPDLTDETRLTGMAEAIHDALRSSIVVAGPEVFVQASIGTTRGQPSTSDARALLRSADLALYRAKRNGRNQTVSFTAELQLEAEQRLATVTALQRALREGRLRLVYQPVVRVDGRLVGAEALLRWEHDGRLLSPHTFLDLAEDTGLILPIGTWVIEQACRDIHSLRAAAPDLQWVSINLSSRQLLDQRLPSVLERALRDADLDPGSLAIEVSESTVRDNPAARRMLHGLGGMKVMLSLDDVTTNQDALRALDGLRIDTIKLDRPFVQQLDVDPELRLRALAGAVLEMADELGVEVVAEGVETTAQMQVLRELGCPLVQGYLYSEPLDLASFITRARSRAEPRTQA